MTRAKTHRLSCAVGPEIAGAETPQELAHGFEEIGIAVHRLVDAVPRDRLDVGDEVGLSPSWVVGHLALLLRTVIESMSGPAAAELPAGFADDFRPGQDGVLVHEEPDLLIALFDQHLELLSSLLKRASPRLLSEPAGRDKFGLLALTPHATLGGQAAAALRYAEMYVVNLAMLCEMP